MRMRRAQADGRPAKSLREAREQLGVSQSELAAELGLSQPAVLKAENAANPTIESVRAYVEGLARASGQGHDLQVLATIGADRFRVRLPRAGSAVSHSVEHSSPTETGHEVRSNEASTAGIGEQRTAWRLRSWDDMDLERTWQAEGIISIGGDEMGDLAQWPGDEDMRRRLTAALPDRTKQAIGMFVTYWRYFRVEMRPGDIVAVPQARRRVGVARIVGDYEYTDHDADPRLWHQRRVEWLRTFPRDELDPDILKVVNAPGTICQINTPGAAGRLARNE